MAKYASVGHVTLSVFHPPLTLTLIVGDSLYYKFTSECMSDDCGYKFTVTGGLLDRFNTGYLILNGVLSVPTVVRWVERGKVNTQVGGTR